MKATYTEYGIVRHLLAAINAANAQGSENSQWEFAAYHRTQTHLPWERNAWPGVPQLESPFTKRYGEDSLDGRFEVRGRYIRKVYSSNKVLHSLEVPELRFIHENSLTKFYTPIPLAAFPLSTTR